MHWKPFIAAAFIALSAPAFADEKGDALVQGWLARIPDILPITAETTTTYKLGKWTAVYRNKVTLAPNNSASSSGPYQFDDGFPMGLFNDPLGDNLDPLPRDGATDRLGLVPVGNSSSTKYLGKETVDSVAYDVVEIHENLIVHITPVSPMLVSLRGKQDNRIAIKWYLDTEGTVRRMTFSAEVLVPGSYVSYQSGFGPPAIKASAVSPIKPVIPPAALPDKTETFTAVMVVDSMRKTRKPLVRAGLADPLFVVPESSHGNCAFSQDGSQLAITGQDKVQIISTSTGLPRYPPIGFKGAGRPNFSLDGKLLAFVDAAGAKVLRAEDGKLIRSIASEQRFSNSARLSPDGKRIALVTGRPEIEIWSVDSGLLERTLKNNGRAYEAIFSGDGKRLVIAVYNSEILVWDTTSWSVTGHLPFRTISGEPLAVSQDGMVIAAVDADNVVRIWDGSGRSPVKTLKGAVGRIRSLTFSSDGKSLYGGDSDELSDLPTGAPGYLCWNLQTGAIVADRSPWQGSLSLGRYYGAVSPDGRFAAFPGSPSSEGSVAVFSLPAGK